MTTTDRLVSDLAAIDSWLQQHAPVSHHTLRPGLDPTGLAALETRYGFPLHPDLRTLLSWHDGCARTVKAVLIWADFSFEDSESMYQQVHDWEEDYWDPRWVPIATDFGLKKLIVDHGTVPGRVMLFDGVEGIYEDEAWPSLGSMISQLRTALATTSQLNGRHAAVEDGELCWPEAT